MEAIYSSSRRLSYTNKEVKNMVNGTVARWLDGRGYGFIKDEDGKDIFVHSSEIQGKNNLREGEKVEFEVTEGNRGPKAVNVKPVIE
jgi:CspA family cold shock protein